MRRLREADADDEGKGMGVAEMQKEKVKVEKDLKVWSAIEVGRRKVEKAMWDMVEQGRPAGMSVADFKVSSPSPVVVCHWSRVCLFRE